MKWPVLLPCATAVAFSLHPTLAAPAPPCAPFACAALRPAGTFLQGWVTAQFSTRAPDSVPLNGWRLVRTPGPDKAEVVSVMRTADVMQSDAELAGIMIRCRSKSALQIGFVVVTPFRPRSFPKVTLTIERSKMQFQADVVPPGSLIALPNEAEALAKGAWQSAKELTIDIDGEAGKIHGVISLENLSGAIAQLQANCPQ